jgi:phage gp29-like protein
MSHYDPSNVVRLPPKPEEGTFISGWRDERRGDEARDYLTPAKLGYYLRAADQGDTRAIYEIFAATEEDPHVYSVLSKRRRRVLSRALEIYPFNDSDQAHRAADLVSECIFGGDRADGIRNLSDGLWDLSDAIGRGFALSQIVWAYTDGLWRPTELKRWPQKECIIGDRRSRFDATDPDEVRILTDEAPTYGEALAPGQWILHIQKARSDALHKAALLRVVVFWQLSKRFTARDWLIFSERYGHPLRLGKYAPGSDTTERNAIRKAVSELGKSAWAIIPEGNSIEFVELKGTGTGSLPYPELVKICNAEISKAILGGTLTTEAGDRGARSLGQVHEDSEVELATDDGRRLCDTLRRDLFSPIVRFNLGRNIPVPYCEFTQEDNQDLLALAQAHQIVIKGIGIEASEEQLREIYQLQPPKDDEDTIGGAAEPVDTATTNPPDAPPENMPNEMRPNVAGVHRAISGGHHGADLGDHRHLADAAVKKKSKIWAA